MATRRSHVGLRHRGPPVGVPAVAPAHTPASSSARRWARALTVALCLAPVGCIGLSEEDEAALSIFRDNTEEYFRRGDYVQAMLNADKAIELDDDIAELRVIRAYCLLRLGEASNNITYIDQSVEQFDEIVDDYDADEQYRGYLGAGSAHLARALVAEREADGIASRLQRGFLDEAEAAREQKNLERAEAARVDHLAIAEERIRDVLALDIHRDNSYALQHLVMVLNRQGQRDAETVAVADRALDLLEDNTRVIESLLQRNAKLSPSRQLELQRQIEMNTNRERLLRDLLATIHANNDDSVAALEQFAVLEERGLMGEAQFYNRAAIYEAVGQERAAIADLESFLRLRAQYLDYDDDEMAPPTFARIERLEARAR